MACPKDKRVKLYTCERCFKPWRKKEMFSKHLKRCKGDGVPPRFQCHQCLKRFSYKNSFRKHKCDGEPVVSTCSHCNKEYLNKKCLEKHAKLCSKRKSWLKSKGFERKRSSQKKNERDQKSGVTNLKKNSSKFEYSCSKCHYRFHRFSVNKIAFHRCASEKMKKVKREMNQYENLFTKIKLHRNKMKKNRTDGCLCYNCGKVFPTREMCFKHYSSGKCNRKKWKNPKKQDIYYKCNFCGVHYEMISVLRRHLRDHAYEKRMLKKLGLGKVGQLRGGGNKSSMSTSAENDAPGPSGLRQNRRDNESSSEDDEDIPLLHLVGNNPILPEKWGWTTHIIMINTPDFDGDLLVRLILSEIKSQISERKRKIRREINDGGDSPGPSSSSDDSEEELENDDRFSTLSMIANLKVYFYKVNIGASLGANNQTTDRKKHLSPKNLETGEDDTLVDAYFHSSPVRLLSGNLEEEIYFIVENFMQQVDEYTTLKSGMKLFRVDNCELNFYNYKSMVGGKEEKIPSHCYMTLHALYSHGKILDISYENISNRVMEEGEEIDIYTNNCFAHVLAAYDYLDDGYFVDNIPIRLDAQSGFIFDKYTQLHVKELMEVEKVNQYLQKYDFSMCSNSGRPMMLDDISKFYRMNYDRDNTIPFINIFKLEHLDVVDDVMLPNGVETHGEKTIGKYTITHYFLARDFEDKSGEDERNVINILYWSETEHFYLITNLRALVLAVNFNNSVNVRSRDRLCYVCLNLIDGRYTEMRDHVRFCRSRNKKQHVSYPIEGKNIDKFKNFRLMNKLLFYVSADTECTNLPIKEPDHEFLMDEFTNDENLERNTKQDLYETVYRSQNFPIKGSSANTVPTHIHRVNSIGWKLNVDEDIKWFPREEFVKKFGGFTQIIMVKDDSEAEEERLVDTFIEWLNKASKFIGRWLMKINDQGIQERVLAELKEKNQDAIKTATHCIYCSERLNQPVLDHCHLTFRMRGMACMECNLKARMDSWANFRLQIYLHNFSKYDSCFITKYMKKPVLAGKRTRKHVWKCRLKGNNIHQIKTNLLDFRDSLDLFPISISRLAKNLPRNQMKHVDSIKWLHEDITKNIYPYDHITSVKRFDDIPFPTIEKFESSLTGKISKKDYDYSKALYDEYCAEFRDWHVHYLKMDVCILLDALVYWQAVIYKEFGIDLLQCHSLPSCAKQSMLKMTGVKLQLITDPTMHTLFQNNIRGGLCITALRSRKVKNQELESIRYFDIKSLYASVQKLYRHPVGEFYFLQPTPEPDTLHNMALGYDEKYAETGYLCVVDLKIPQKLHSLLSDFPVTYQKMSVDPSMYPPTSKWHYMPKSKTLKLIPSLIDAKEYGVSMLTLSFLVRLGLIIEKVHHVVAYKQEYFLRDFVDICLRKRKESGLKMDDVTFKLISNGLFGKFIENAFLYTDTKFVFNKSDYERILQNSTRFVNAKFEKYGVLMQNRLSVVKMDKPIAVGWSILCKSKTHFQEMYYFRILPAYIKVVRPLTFQNRLRVMYVDTDSLILYLCLNSDQEMHFYSLLRDIFDFSMLPKSDRLFSSENELIVGIFKDEVEGLLIRSQHSNCPKSYLYTIENNTGLDVRLMNEKERMIYCPRIKMKAISRYFQDTLVTEADFEQIFSDPNKERRLTYSSLRIGYERKMFKFTCVKKVMDSHDSKRWVYPSQTDSLALGHYLTFDADWVKKMMEETKTKCNI